MELRSVGSITILFLALQAPLYSWQAASSWRDPSPHNVLSIPVDKDVRLEVLDWGGAGRPIIMLAGAGNTAHVFDEFAPKLTANHHIYGITRRGFGASGFSASGSGVDRLRDDVLAVMDALKLDRPVLVGHSIAGAELSSVATSYPDRVAGLVYLEAGYPYAFDNGKGPTNMQFQDIQNIKGLQPPTPVDSDLASFSALQKWAAEVRGFRIPEAEFHQTWESGPDGRSLKARSFQGWQMFGMILGGNKRYSSIPVRALAIFAIPHIPENWMSNSTNHAVREAVTAVGILREKQAKVFEDGVPTARVIRLRGTHYVFLSDEAAVLREMRAFLASLR